MEDIYTNKERQTLEPRVDDEIHVAVGENALELLSDENFQAKWDLLYHTCYWSTVFQNAAFTNAWYKLYKKAYIPILITAYKDDRLTGLLNLCLNLQKLEITGTGCDDAHYHTWLAEEYNKESFITSALAKVKEQFPSYRIRLYQLPPHTPLGWLETDPRWRASSTFKIYKRPLIDLSHPELPKLSTKKQFKENRNRLKRHGEVTYEKVTCIEQFSSIFDVLIDQYDFRKGATLNFLPFRGDPIKKKFFMELFRLEMLHVTVLKLNNEIVASLIGTIGKDSWVHGAGLNTHAPTYACFSPGFVCFIMMAQQLANEKFRTLDLSTGGQGYKERLANSHDQVYELIISNQTQSRIKIPQRIKGFLLQRISQSGIDYKRLRIELKRKKMLAKEKWSLFKKQGLNSGINTALRIAIPEAKEELFQVRPITMRNLKAVHAIGIEQNSLKALLLFSGSASLTTRWEFLEEAMFRLEIGEQAYTWTENNKLVACLWLLNSSAKKKEYTSQHQYPEGSTVLHRLYYRPEYKDKVALFLAAVIGRIKTTKDIEDLYLLAKPNDALYCGLSPTPAQLDRKHLQHETAPSIY